MVPFKMKMALPSQRWNAWPADLNVFISGQEYDLWEGKVIFILQRAITLENIFFEAPPRPRLGQKRKKTNTSPAEIEGHAKQLFF